MTTTNTKKTLPILYYNNNNNITIIIADDSPFACVYQATTALNVRGIQRHRCRPGGLSLFAGRLVRTAPGQNVRTVKMTRDDVSAEYSTGTRRETVYGRRSDETYRTDCVIRGNTSRRSQWKKKKRTTQTPTSDAPTEWKNNSSYIRENVRPERR